MKKTISMIRNRRLRFHSDLDAMVQKICTAHQAETTNCTTSWSRGILIPRNNCSRPSRRRKKILNSLHRRKSQLKRLPKNNLKSRLPKLVFRMRLSMKILHHLSPHLRSPKIFLPPGHLKMFPCFPLPSEMLHNLPCH